MRRVPGLRQDLRTPRNIAHEWAVWGSYRENIKKGGKLDWRQKKDGEAETDDHAISGALPALKRNPEELGKKR